jgi:hypothetical protein
MEDQDVKIKFSLKMMQSKVKMTDGKINVVSFLVKAKVFAKMVDNVSLLLKEKVLENKKK